jgi:hypothetical protein
MDSVAEEIRAFLTPPLEPTDFSLEFDYNDKHYKTKFTASHKGPIIEVGNKCINMTFGYYYNKEFIAGCIGCIEANAPEKSCFEPLLVTNARNKPGKRTTAADVLQILKTKLGLAFPVATPITINDGASKPAKSDASSPTMISPFHLLRGGPAFYEKYGYKSAPITMLKAKIPTFPWGSFTAEQKATLEPFVGVHEDAELLTDIMKKISWDQEIAYNDKSLQSLSYNVFRHFAVQNGIPFEKSNQWDSKGIWGFTLDQDSEEWKKCNADLVLTRFEVVKKGGNRRSLKKRRSVKSTRRARK